MIVGRPYIENLGHISIGDRFRFSALPARSHLVTGRGGVLEIGDDVRIDHGAAVSATTRICIGNGVQIGPFVVMLDADFHGVVDRDAAGETAPIEIGSNARIGSRVTILRGATIGPGARIAAGSVVGGQVAAGAHVRGNPARPVDSATSRDSGEFLTPAELRAVIKRTLGLATEPADRDGPNQIAAWDSLGALNLLLALEEASGVALRQEDVMHARCVGDLIRAVSTTPGSGAAV
jgi:acetyltransferase-like isoleucine patch superfamily enzyme/acyl carrier protein